MRSKERDRHLILLAVLAVLGVSVAAAGGQTTLRVSVSSTGQQGNDDSRFPSLSAGGRHTAFASFAANLVVGDTNNALDVFVHDRDTGETSRVSVNFAGEQGNDWSAYPSISADGRYVAFYSLADNLVEGDTNETYDVFVHDRLYFDTTRVSVDSAGGQADGYSTLPELSADGRYVVFQSSATNLVPDDTNGVGDVFVHDRQTGQTTRVSVSSTGQPANAASLHADISADGRYVAFRSDATNLVDNDTNGYPDVFVHDRQTGQTTRVSVSSAGSQGDSGSDDPSLCGTGRFVAFASAAANLVDGDTNGCVDIFIHDRSTGQTTRASLSSSGEQADGYSFLPGLSADGRLLAFDSDAANLVPNDTNDRVDVFVHDRITGHTVRASLDADQHQANDQSQYSCIAPDATHVAFDSYATNLADGDTNDKVDVFVRNLCCIAADLDSDGDMDSSDVELFESCATGPGVPQGDPSCRRVDLDDDGDVDHSDFGLLQRCLSGPAEPE